MYKCGAECDTGKENVYSYYDIKKFINKFIYKYLHLVSRVGARAYIKELTSPTNLIRYG